MLAVLLVLMPALVILAFRTLCTWKTPPASAYGRKRPPPTPAPVPWAPDSDRCRR